MEAGRSSSLFQLLSNLPQETKLSPNRIVTFFSAEETAIRDNK